MFLKEIFYFRHTDRLMVGLLLVVACVAGIAFMLTGGGGECSNTAAPDSAATAAPDMKHATAVTQPHGVAPQARLFRFDPNTADSLTLLSLGLQPWLVHNVCRYRERGGTYRKPDDFARTYGLTVRQFRALKPYYASPPTSFLLRHLSLRRRRSMPPLCRSFVPTPHAAPSSCGRARPCL